MNTVIDFLEDSYKRFPHKVACEDEKESITYEQLWYDSERIANWLVQNVDMSVPVALVAIKSTHLLIIIWSIIKAGGCYVVIDPLLPGSRVRSILNILSPALIVSSNIYKKKIANDDSFIDIRDLLHVVEKTERNIQLYDSSPLYIMFTSGTTGIPKGVVISHRSVVDFIDAFVDVCRINDKDIIGNQAPWDFDVSVKDIFASAKASASLHLIPRKLFSFPKQLVDVIYNNKVTTLIWSVSALRILLSGGDLANKPLSEVNKIIFSGEVMSTKHYNSLRGVFPEALIVNAYGPTEITCNCTYHILKGTVADDKTIPIGKPFENEKVFLLDEENKLIEKNRIGVSGEICVSGTSVAMGYYANEEATRKSFVQNPLNDKYIEIIYRTGDLAYYSSNEELIYNGRKDNQIKHNGHRIELEEIERAINLVDGVFACCCIYKNEQIYAFIEGDKEEKLIQKEIRSFLPDYMIPSFIMAMERLPLNEHGKIDRNTLYNINARKPDKTNN